MVLQDVIQNLSKNVVRTSIDRVFQQRVAGPLGLRDTEYRQNRRNKRRRVAASEKGNYYEWQTSVEMGFVKPTKRIPKSLFRDSLIWGEVHDGNADLYAGVAGQAGLFSTAEEVFKLALQFLPAYSRLLRPKACE